MKRVCFVLSFFMLFTAFTCENEPLEGDFVSENQVLCETAEQRTIHAALEFSESTDDTYEVSCIAYKTALQNQILFCGDPNGILVLELESIPSCSTEEEEEEEEVIIVVDCVSATAAVGVAQSAFSQATSDNYTELCNVYKQSLLTLIDFCGDDGGTQSVLSDLGNCMQ